MVDVRGGAPPSLEPARRNLCAASHERLRSLAENSFAQLGAQTAALTEALQRPEIAARLAEAQLRNVLQMAGMLEHGDFIPAARGRWAEVQLQNVLQIAGLLESCEFIEQPARSADDDRLAPNLIVRLAGGCTIAVDAKVPSAQYLQAAEAVDEATRAIGFARHARAVREHLGAVSHRARTGALGEPGLVVLFLPGEAFLGVALLHDPTLVEASVKQRVLLATPIAFTALLRTVALGWQEHALELRQLHLGEQAQALHERVTSLASHWLGEIGVLGEVVNLCKAGEQEPPTARTGETVPA